MAENKLIDTETAFLASIITDAANFDSILDVNCDWFTVTYYADIFDALRSLYIGQTSIDSVSVVSFLRQAGKPGAADKIEEIVNSSFTSSNFSSYQSILEEQYIRRRVLDDLRTYIKRIENAEIGGVMTEMDGVEQGIYEIKQKTGQHTRTSSMGDVGIDAMRHLRKIRETGISPYVANIGLADVDNIIGGFTGGEMIVLAGRPSMGKSTFAIQMCLNNIAQGKSVGFISVEMPSREIFMKVLSNLSGLDGSRLHSGQITNLEYEQLSDIWREINKMSFYIDDTASLNVVQLRGLGRKMKSFYDIDLLFIDYLQLLDAVGVKEGRQQEITKISRSIKALAKELDIPVIALSQLSRKVEERESKRPILSDLRESGSIEQDADKVFFLYRPEYYRIDKFDDGTPSLGLAEVIVAKNRVGDTGSCKAVFDRKLSRFLDFSKHHPNELL